MVEVITSPHNPLIKQIRSLHQKKGRDEMGLFLVEGIHHVGEAVEAGWNVEALVYSPEQLKSDFAVQLVHEFSARGGRTVPLEPRLFSTLAEKENPQGILALVRQRRLTLNDVQANTIQYAAALVSPQDPGNVGTVLRTLDAVNGDALFLLDGGVELYHPSVVRASMGALFWKPVIQASFQEFAAWARWQGFLLAGTSAHAQMDYREFQRTEQPLILVFGSEQKGLSAEQLEACDVRLFMPMRGRASSLNFSVAAGILLYQYMDQK